MRRAYRVIVTPNAADDIRQAFAWYRDRNPRAAADWLAGLRRTILGLSDRPGAHPVAPESTAFDIEIRRALYGRGTRWRIYYTIEEADVRVLHVRHGRRSTWTP